MRKSVKLHELPIRSLIKAITFRVVVFTSDMTIILWITQQLNYALNIVLLTNIFSTVIFYFHERVWNYIEFDKIHTPQNKIHESRFRSVVKALSYRFLVIISDLIVISTFTNEIWAAVNIMIMTNIASTILYIIHERVWNAIHFGKEHRK